MSLSQLPKLAPVVIRRPRIESWLMRNAAVPLRFLTAPAGSGKTTAIASYLAGITGSTAYVRVIRDESPEDVRGRIATSLHLPVIPDSYAAFLAALAQRAPCEITIDEIDCAAPETLDELNALVTDSPAGVSLIYAGQARSAIDYGHLLARGHAVSLDGNDLAFNADDIAQLAERLSISYTAADVTRLLEETEGWPIVVCGVLREAMEKTTSLCGAYDRWRKGSGRHFARFIDSEVRRANAYHRSAFHLALKSDAGCEQQDQLAALETRGLFVRYTEDGFRPYRVVRQFTIDDTQAVPVAPKPASLLVVRMFGRFEAEIDGHGINWIRRRDQQIFKYLLLKPSGTATRSELREVFWPDADLHLATQSVRTACSNIRKAIAALVGYEAAERYFSSRGDIVVNLSQTVLDVRRFTAHVADGDAELERGRVQEAAGHYRAAESLYSGELLGGDYPEPWYLPRAEIYKSLYIAVLERLAEISLEINNEQAAFAYAQRVLKLQPLNDRMRHIGHAAYHDGHRGISRGKRTPLRAIDFGVQPA